MQRARGHKGSAAGRILVRMRKRGLAAHRDLATKRGAPGSLPSHVPDGCQPPPSLPPSPSRGSSPPPPRCRRRRRHDLPGPPPHLGDNAGAIAGAADLAVAARRGHVAVWQLGCLKTIEITPSSLNPPRPMADRTLPGDARDRTPSTNGVPRQPAPASGPNVAAAAAPDICNRPWPDRPARHGLRNEAATNGPVGIPLSACRRYSTSARARRVSSGVGVGVGGW